ncbi:MAG: type II toxin-antitoxin system RelE/ParE family toxin [Armatimonadetes bacterium]|nr:type II toxin-antitoxin system RelE/ParE family toxin [Armatimonadota bacterium]
MSEPAEIDIDSTFHYLLLRSPEAAERFRNGITDALESLTQMPQRCAIAPENEFFDVEVRQLIYRYGRSAYRILFTVFAPEADEPGIVRIIRIRHGAQQLLGHSTDQADEQDGIT